MSEENIAELQICTVQAENVIRVLHIKIDWNNDNDSYSSGK